MFIYTKAKVDAVITKETNTDCVAPKGFYTRVCGANHRQRSPMRCHKCDNCEKNRQHRIYAELLRRIKIYGHTRRNGLPKLYLWTLGTSSTDFEHLARCFKRFRNWLSRSGKNQMEALFYVFEKGKAGYAHVHLLVQGFASHSKILLKWRSICGENANVNFAKRRTPDYEKAVKYLLKYVTKSNGSRRNYYYLGALTRIKSEVYPAICGEKRLNNEMCREPIRYFIIHNREQHDLRNAPLEYFNWCNSICKIVIPKYERLFGYKYQMSLFSDHNSNLCSIAQSIEVHRYSSIFIDRSSFVIDNPSIFIDKLMSSFIK